MSSDTRGDRLLRISKVAELLDCSQRHVWTLIQRGDLRPANAGSGTERRMVRIAESEVQRFIAARTKRASGRSTRQQSARGSADA